MNQEVDSLEAREDLGAIALDLRHSLTNLKRELESMTLSLGIHGI
ncbi:MAG TPA: hypothetical protein V6D16_07210 [Candidatus Obscuribacterales bacterium]